MTLNDLKVIAYHNCQSKGFWDEERNMGEMIALCHSELSEALEEIRKNPNPLFEYSDGGKPCGFISELGDCIIRILDICGYLNVDIERIILDKMQYNSKREYKHGKVF